MLFADGIRAFGVEFGNCMQLIATSGGGTITNGYNRCNDATLDRHCPFTIDDSLDTGV